MEEAQMQRENLQPVWGLIRNNLEELSVPLFPLNIWCEKDKNLPKNPEARPHKYKGILPMSSPRLKLSESRTLLKAFESTYFYLSPVEFGSILHLTVGLYGSCLSQLHGTRTILIICPQMEPPRRTSLWNSACEVYAGSVYIPVSDLWR